MNMLSGPRGIFVDQDFSIYVTECYNDRVQRFPLNSLNGTIVAGNGVTGSFALNCPQNVILDGNGYLYIADSSNHRIIASGPLGSRCIIGCTGTSGSAANQLNLARALSFDGDGNLFVVDRSNFRLQKYLLASNSCGQ